MSVCVDIAWKSLNKHGEELCGDKVEVLKTEDSDIVILADGMGSGVKANILATLTSKILGTMFLNGADIESCVETIARTLPVCKVREVAYATFSILQVFRDGRAYLAEFDNPACVFIRERRIVAYPYEERMVEQKKIREYRFQAKLNDCFVLMSDGAIYAGTGERMNFGWTWDDMAQYTLRCTKDTLSASRLAAMLSEVCYELYGEKPGDDTTVAVIRITKRQVVNIFTGPPAKREDDEKVIHELMRQEGKKVVCGGTSANIAARVLHREITTSVDHTDPSVPPTASIEGLDLVTEGVLTMGKALALLKKYEKDEFDEEFFTQLDQKNGASRLAKLIIEECTDLHLYVGKALNPAHQSLDLPFDLSVRMNLVEQLKECAEHLGKTVTVEYY